ncbi:MAG: LCP family protein [Actinomycetota bacterium]
MTSERPLSRFTGAPRWMITASFALVLSLAGALGIVRATNSALDGVSRVEAVAPVLSGPCDGVVNYLLVGSDSRVGADPNDEDFAAVGSEDATPGMRSDTISVVRRDRGTGAIALMSVPRDLWVKIGDSEKHQKINAAYQRGPDVLVRTVQRALNIPIHHYLEINFSGFKRVVDAIGGVHVCVDAPSRDKATGFYIGKRACKRVDGAQALAYARSRYFEEKIDGSWRKDGTGDVGRGERQRMFIGRLAKDALAYLSRHPLESSSVFGAVTSAVSVDPALDLVDLGRELRPLADGTSVSYNLPVDSGWAGDAFVFRLAKEAQPLLGYFSGVGEAPPPPPPG